MKTRYIILFGCVLLVSCTTIPTQPPRAPKNISIIELLSSPKKGGRSPANKSIASDKQSSSNVFVDSSIDGSWKLSHLECPEGAQPQPDVEAYFLDKNNFSYFHFEKGTLTTQSAEKSCLIEGIGSYKIESRQIILSPPKSWNRRCPAKESESIFARGEQDPLVIQTNHDGDPELVFELRTGESCNDGSHGKAVLIRNLTE